MIAAGVVGVHACPYISVGRNGQKNGSRILFVPKLIFFVFLGPLESRQSQNGGGTIFTPLDHLLTCIIPRWPPKIYRPISLLIEVGFE